MLQTHGRTYSSHALNYFLKFLFTFFKENFKDWRAFQTAVVWETPKMLNVFGTVTGLPTHLMARLSIQIIF